jgi:adenosylcobinamide kinase / adenosylcobinamide-phosphate guanylyltransferase
VEIHDLDGARRTLTLDAPAQLVAGPGTSQGLLWAPDCASLPPDLIEGLPAGSVRLALLGPGPAGDLRRCATTAAALRRAGALVPGAVLAVLDGHDSARMARRDLLLRSWGLQEPADGTQWLLGADRSQPGERPQPRGHDQHGPGRVLVIGGAASGKSQLAEDLLAAAAQVTYLATGQPAAPDQDPDWAQRVLRHQHRRPSNWATLETADPATALSGLDHALLLDSLGSWLTGVLDRAGAWHQAPGWRAAVDRETHALVSAYANRAGDVVVVSDEVGLGVIPATPSGRLFRDLLGQLNQAVADQSDDVVTVVAGQVLSCAGHRP